MRAILLGVLLNISMIFSNSNMHDMHSHPSASIDNDMNDNISISKRILDSMHGPMKELSNSKNIEVDFLQDMIPHHQGAINSARLYLDHGKSEQLKVIAKNIISSQEEEIRYFVELLSNINKNISKDYAVFHDKSKETMNNMMSKMSSMTVSGDIDVDFIKAMIFHHEGAIQSAKDVLDYTKNNDIKDIAKNIIQMQEQEIRKMKDILKSIS